MGRQINEGVPFVREIKGPPKDKTLPQKPWYRRQCQEFVGLDIGSHSIKLMRLRRGKPWKVMAIAMAPLPSMAIREGRIMNFAQVIEVIRKLVQETKSEGLECAIAISGSYVITKSISMTEMTQEEFEGSFLWEAEMYIPFDLKDVNVDGYILNPKAGQGQMDTLMVAAKKEAVEEYLSVVKEAGLKPVVVEPAVITLLNLYKMIYPDLSLSNSPPVVVIDVGANSTKIGVLAGGSPAFFRDVSMGSSNLTQEIQRHFNISWEEAEAWKKDVEDPDKFQDDANYGHLKETHRLAKLAAETLVTEIQRALDFFIATSVKADITRIYLTGGGGIPNHYLVNSLERRIEAPVEVLNPFKNLAYSSSTIFEQYPGSWALAIGLALRGLDEETPGLVRINLLGSQKKSSPQPKNRWRNLKALAKYLFTRKQPQKVKVSRQELLYVCDTMNLFMSANVPLLDGLHTLAEAFKGPLAEALIYVRMRVGEGRPLYEPFTEKGFPNFFCLTVKAGEITGTLDIALEKYATNMRKDKPPRKFW